MLAVVAVAVQVDLVVAEPMQMAVMLTEGLVVVGQLLQLQVPQ
jgi:hypothetical protein